jgi:L-iditol 2-dehydrogenase
MCFKLPEDVTLEKGAMCEPLSVGACMPLGRCWTPPPTKVLILGVGLIGFVTMLAAHAFGSPKVVIADISVERLKVTTELGADATVLVSTDLKVRKEFRFILVSNVRLLTLDWEGWMDANQFLTTVSVFCYCNTYPLSLYLISGQINVKPLITTQFGFSESKVKDASETSAKGGSAINWTFVRSGSVMYRFDTNGY